MQEDKARRLGDVAVERRMITPQQLDECLQIQEKLKGMGIEETLGEIMVKKSYLNKGQIDAILKLMGIDVQKIPGYRLLARLGRGGMGTVYKAHHQAMDRTVALKILDREATRTPSYVKRFLREARAAANLDHPNIVRAFDAGQANDVYYFAMEYVPGETVYAQIKRMGPYSEASAIHVTRQVAEALDYLSKQGLIHRDVKPENMIVDREGVARLCDFGLAKSMVDGTLTRSGFTFGTPYYMSPEQINSNARVDVRSDLYSLGACLYFMLTGRPMFEDKDLQVVLSKHLTEKPGSPKAVNPNVSDGLVEIFRKMVEKEPSRRYRNPRELMSDLRRVDHGLAPQNARKGRGSGRPVALALGASAVMALAGAGAWFLYDRSEKQTPTAPRRRVQPTARRPQAPRPDPKRQEREQAARKLFEEAEAAFQTGQWQRAFEGYGRIRSEYKGTAFYANDEQRRTIFNHQAISRSKLADLGADTSDEWTAEQKRVRAVHTEALGLVEAKRWDEAVIRLQELLAGATLPDDLQPALINELIVRCQAEQQAKERFETIQGSAEAREWSAVLAGAGEFRTRFASSRTLQSVHAPLEGLEKQARYEIGVAEVIRKADLAFQAKEWAQYRELVKDLREKHGRSGAVVGAEPRFKEREEAIRREEQLGMEQRAETIFKEAEAARKKGEYEAARRGYESLKQFESTEFVRGRQGAIRNALRAMDKEETAQRYKTLNRRYRELRSLVDKKRYEDAARLMEELQEQYEDAPLWDQKQKELESLVEKIEQGIHKERYAVRWDFERGRGPWEVSGPGGPGIWQSDERANGRKGGTFEIGPHDASDEWARIWMRVPRGLSPLTRGITFNIRAGNPETRMVWALLITRVEGEWYYYVAERTVSSNWIMHRVVHTGFRPIQGQRNPPKLRLEDVRAFGFARPPNQPRNRYHVDDINTEYR